jgi:hypothetical protein
MAPTQSQALIVEPGVRLAFVTERVSAICLWARHDNEAQSTGSVNEMDHRIWFGWCHADGELLETLDPTGL